MSNIDGKTLKALIEAGAIRRVRIIGEGSIFRVEADTQSDPIIVNTLAGKLKTWSTLDAAAKWIHSLGIGSLQVDLEKWQPEQRGMKL